MAASTPSIEKLQKKLEKEPNSLIFLQLAEEYRKEGEYEEALRTCKEGLRRHPNYWSARVALGRISHEMGDTDSAREELEKVVKAVPDNLLANKLLGDIYMESGRMPDALKRYQIVQMLTPNDQEVVTNLQQIEAQMMNSARPKAPPTPPPPVPPAPAEPPVAVMDADSTFMDAPPEPPASIELPDFLEKTEPGVRAASIHLMDSTMPQRDSPSSNSSSQADMDSAESSGVEIEPDLAAMFMESTHSNEIPVAPSFGAGKDEHFSKTFSPTPMELDPTDEPLASPPITNVDRTQPMQDKQDKEDAAEFEADELTTQTLAELYVQQGLTDKAVKVFQKLLLNDPGNPLIVARLRELSPADALLSMAAANDREEQAESFARHVAPAQTGRPSDQRTDDRRRKITTLENWLAAIRRERS